MRRRYRSGGGVPEKRPSHRDELLRRRWPGPQTSTIYFEWLHSARDGKPPFLSGKHEKNEKRDFGKKGSRRNNLVIFAGHSWRAAALPAACHHKGGPETVLALRRVGEEYPLASGYRFAGVGHTPRNPCSTALHRIQLCPPKYPTYSCTSPKHSP